MAENLSAADALAVARVLRAEATTHRAMLAAIEDAAVFIDIGVAQRADEAADYVTDYTSCLDALLSQLERVVT